MRDIAPMDPATMTNLWPWLEELIRHDYQRRRNKIAHLLASQHFGCERRLRNPAWDSVALATIRALEDEEDWLLDWLQERIQPSKPTEKEIHDMRPKDSEIQELEGKVRLLEYEVRSLKSQKEAANRENERLHDHFEKRLADKERELQLLLDDIFRPGWTREEARAALELIRAKRARAGQQGEASHAA
jgi:hypothetical protein